LSNRAPAGRDTGAQDLVAGAAAALFMPLATFWLGIAWWLSLPLAALVFLGVRLALSPRELFEGFRFKTIDQASLALAREVLERAHADHASLVAAANAIKGDAVRDNLKHLRAIVERVIAEVEQKPHRINNVRRLLTYYLPGALRLANGYRTLESQLNPNHDRMAAAAGMIGRLDGVFAAYADKLTEQEVEGLDVEIKLLEAEIANERRQ
jgi:hypothetical protein